MPLEAAILWTPVSGAAQGLPTIPIFVTQRALAAVQDHGAATSGACSGLLTGDLFRSPETGAPFVMVESTIRLPGSAGDDAKTALLEGWVVAQDVLRRTGEQLVGWYRLGDDATLGLNRAQAEAHAALFPQPWQIVITVGSGVTPAGGVYRPSGGNASGFERLAFYEVLDPAAHAAGTARTRVAWANYRPDRNVSPPAPAPVVGPPALRASGPVSAPGGARVPPIVFLPDPGDAGHVGRPADGVLRRWLSNPRTRRVAAATAVGLAAIVGAARWLRSSSPAPIPTPDAPAVAPPLERLDRAADTLGLALAAFDLRARLFASRQMQCPELARGLVLVEERWTAYNAVRKESGVVLDSVRSARDQGLYADADAVERRFERSRCPRP